MEWSGVLPCRVVVHRSMIDVSRCDSDPGGTREWGAAGADVTGGDPTATGEGKRKAGWLASARKCSCKYAEKSGKGSSFTGGGEGEGRGAACGFIDRMCGLVRLFFFFVFFVSACFSLAPCVRCVRDRVFFFFLSHRAQDQACCCVVSPCGSECCFRALRECIWYTERTLKRFI